MKAPRDKRSYFREGGESLALAYLAGFLRAHGRRVVLVDGQLEGLTLKGTLTRCMSWEPQVIGFTIADPSFIPSTYRVASSLKETMPHVHLTIGGYAPTFHYAEVLKQCAALDSVVRHEGEQTLLELVEALAESRDWRTIPGIAYCEGDKVLCNDSTPLISDLDTLPFPARDYVPYIKEKLPDIGVVSVSASRGCYADCAFCSIRRFYSEPGGSVYRLRSVTNVVDEIASIVGEFGVDEFLLVDDIFTLPGPTGKKRVEEWQRELRQRGLEVMLSISDRVDHVRRPIYDVLYDIGVRQIMVGVEATHPEILRYLNKRITFGDVQRALAILKELGIDVTITYINFTPRTTLDILRDNLDCLLSLNVNFLLGLLNRLQVYVGTPIATEMIDAGMVTGIFPDFSYKIPDTRVEVVYEICRRCFAPFLEVSYEIMKLERMFRVKAFRLAKVGEDPSLLSEGKQWFGGTCRRIMREAAGLFGTAISYVERNKAVDGQFVLEMREAGISQYNLWHRELLLMRDYSPFFEHSDRSLLR